MISANMESQSIESNHSHASSESSELNEVDPILYVVANATAAAIEAPMHAVGTLKEVTLHTPVLIGNRNLPLEVE